MRQTEEKPTKMNRPPFRTITTNLSELMYNVAMEFGYERAYLKFAEHSRTHIKRSVSDHIDRVIEQHRNQKPTT